MRGFQDRCSSNFHRQRHLPDRSHPAGQQRRPTGRRSRYPNALLAQPAGASVGAANLQFLAPGIKTPYSQQGTVAVEHQMTRDTAVTVSYIWSRGLQLYGVRDLNVNAPTTSFTYTIQDANGNQTGTYTTPVYQLPPRPIRRYAGMYQVQNGVNSYYNGLAVYAAKRIATGLQATLSYTWSHAIDYGQGAGNDALFFSNVNNYSFPNGNFKFDKGSARLDQRHRFVFAFVWQPTITPSRRNVLEVRGQQLAVLQHHHPGERTPHHRDHPHRHSQSFPNMLATNTINGSGGIFRVPFWPVNSLYSPPIYRDDARISKLLPLSERITLYLNFEAFNITNTQVDTSIAAQAFTGPGESSGCRRRLTASVRRRADSPMEPMPAAPR